MSIQHTDGKGRITLGAQFANTKVVVEVIGEDEVRILAVDVIPKRELWLYENPQAISSVFRGLEQAHNRKFSKFPPTLFEKAKGKKSAKTKRAGR